MPNVLNNRMLSEIEGFLNDGEDCVVVDFTGMSVEVAEDVRNKLRDHDMEMKVVKTSLARIAAKNLGYEGGDEVFRGSSAMVYGGESVAAVAKTVVEIQKEKKTPVVKGGLLDKKVLSEAEVQALSKLPTRPELLSQVLGTIIAPLTHLLGANNTLLTAVPGLTKALEEKLGGSEGAE